MPAKFLRHKSGVLVVAKRQTGGPVRRWRGALRACSARGRFVQSVQEGLDAATREAATSRSSEPFVSGDVPSGEFDAGCPAGCQMFGIRLTRQHGFVT